MYYESYDSKTCLAVSQVTVQVGSSSIRTRELQRSSHLSESVTWFTWLKGPPRKWVGRNPPPFDPSLLATFTVTLGRFLVGPMCYRNDHKNVCNHQSLWLLHCSESSCSAQMLSCLKCPSSTFLVGWIFPWGRSGWQKWASNTAVQEVSWTSSTRQQCKSKAISCNCFAISSITLQ